MASLFMSLGRDTRLRSENALRTCSHIGGSCRFFYDGITPTSRILLDNSVGEFLHMKKTIEEALELIEMETKASIRNLEVQMGQLAKQVTEVAKKSTNTFSSNTVPNPREECKAIHLRSGKAISSNGIEFHKTKVEVIEKLQPPANVKAIQSFLGHAGFYRRFIKDFSKIAKPLINLLVADVPFCFTDDCMHAFETLKAKLEFDIEIRDQKGSENQVADHLSSIEPEEVVVYPIPVNEVFPYEQLFVIHGIPWFVDIANYKVSKIIPEEFTKQQVKKLFHDAKNCDQCQRVGNLPKHNEMPQQAILEVELFDVWRIDFMGQLPPSYSNNYILVAVNYVSKWVEAVPLATNDAKFVISFLQRQVEVSNRELKWILEKILIASRKDWVKKIDDALWAYRKAFKTPISMSSYQLVYDKTCHLLVELEHRTYWATKFLNFDPKAARQKRLLQLNELDEFQTSTYENAKLYNEKIKVWHDKKIIQGSLEQAWEYFEADVAFWYLVFNAKYG
nr:uncharacterized protein LOC112721084 [Arachis hypogaea]